MILKLCRTALQPCPFIEFGWKVVHLVVLRIWLQTSF